MAGARPRGQSDQMTMRFAAVRESARHKADMFVASVDVRSRG